MPNQQERIEQALAPEINNEYRYEERWELHPNEMRWIYARDNEVPAWARPPRNIGAVGGHMVEEAPADREARLRNAQAFDRIAGAQAGQPPYREGELRAVAAANEPEAIYGIRFDQVADQYRLVQEPPIRPARKQRPNYDLSRRTIVEGIQFIRNEMDDARLDDEYIDNCLGDMFDLNNALYVFYEEYAFRFNKVKNKDLPLSYCRFASILVGMNSMVPVSIFEHTIEGDYIGLASDFAKLDPNRPPKELPRDEIWKMFTKDRMLPKDHDGIHGFIILRNKKRKLDKLPLNPIHSEPLPLP